LNPRVHLRIDKRFCGPPDSANGGYTAGLLAQQLAAPCVTVRLLASPPLERELVVASEPTGAVVLFDTEVSDDPPRVLARAQSSQLDLQVPERVSFEAAASAARSSQAFTLHPFACCFVCGPQRTAGDGLRIFAGPMQPERTPQGLVAAPWIPDDSLAAADGAVAAQFHWAALDCPGYFACAAAGTTMLLGEITAKLLRRVAPGERCVVMAWPLGRAGRRRVAATALFGADGALCGAASTTWIEMKAPDATTVSART
jgi:hypothetical protein